METDEPAAPEPAPEEKPPSTHYEALGISQTATASEVKKAYYSKCRIHHPDKNAQDTNSTRRFQFIAEAYQILSSTTKRAQYDATLVMQQACGNLGVQNDPRATLFVQRHSAVAGREVQCMQVEARHVQHLVGKNGYQLQHLKHQSGADLLVLQSNLSVNAQVLLAGSSMQISAARSLILTCIAELTGSQAPRDGVVLIVPTQSLPRMPQVAAQFQTVYLQTGAAARFATADRIVVQGGLRVPQAVVQIQWTLEWRAYILLPTGQTLTPWTYAHYCEAAGIAATPTTRPGEAYQYLLPPADPDGTIARSVICFALGVAEDNETVRDKPLVELATRALQSSTGRPVTGALVRTASSVAVHAEHSSLSVAAGAPLLCALQAVFQVAGPNIAQRFANAPLFKTLNALCTALTDAREGVALRARGFTAIREAVPEDGKWHSWEELASDGGALATFWQDLRTWITDRRQSLGVGSPPQEWLVAPAVMSQLLRVCVAPPVECDAARGIRRPVATAPPASAAARAAAAAPAAAQAPRPVAPKEQGSVDAAGQPAAAGGNIAVPEEARCEESDSLTPLEITEEVVQQLASAGTDSKAFLPIGVISQEAQRRVGTGGAAPERFSKKWYESHKGSFELKRLPDDFRVRLTPAAAARVTARVHERQAEQQRARELRVAEEVLPKLSAESLPRTLRAPELSALLGVLSRGQHRGIASGDEQNLAPALMRRLCRRGDATPKEVLQDSTPFTPALMMRAIVHIEGTKRQRWDKDSLDIVLQAAALDMHAVEDRPRAPLSTAAVALWAGAKRPFDDRLNASKCLLVPSAALRLQVELAEGAALQPDGSLFRPFAQMCVWLAHLVVATTLPEDVYGEVLQAFKKLANACEELGKSPESAPCDPEGLCRLAMAIALVARGAEKGGAARPPGGSGFGVEALEGLARICVNRAMDESYDWKPQQLAVLASAFSSAEVTHQGLFMKISVRAERHVLLGNEWSTEQLVKLLNAAFQLNALPTLSKLLNTLQMDNGFSKYVREAKDRDLPMFVSVLSLIHDGDVLEELGKVHRDKLQGVNLPGLIAILKELPPADECGRELGHFRSSAIKEAVTRAQRKAPTQSELTILVEAAASDPRKSSSRLAELGSSPALLNTLPPVEASLQDLRIGIEAVLIPFVAANVEVPRLEAACAGRLLLAAERAGGSLDVLSLAQAVLAMREGALGGMPGFAAAVADRLARARLPRVGSDATDVRKVIERLVTCALRAAKGPAKGRGGDAELDGWVERLERAATDDGRAYEKRLDQLEQQATRRLPQGVRDALGTTWLPTLLVRAQKMSWTGSKVVLLEAPRLLRAAKRLAEVGGAHLPASLREEASRLDAEPWEPLPAEARPSARAAANLGDCGGPSPRPRVPPAAAPIGAIGMPQQQQHHRGMPPAPSRTVASPASLVVIGGRDAGMAKTLAGSYAPTSTNHGCAVYSRVDPAEENTVLLYYWDDRDGEEQSGWWFGPEVGGEEVWAHHTGMPGNKLPPVRGWKVLHSGEIDPGLLVQRSDLPRTSLGTAQSLPSPSSLGTKRPRVDGARAEELRAWLEGLDDGAGAMLQYYDVLASEFDADLQQIAAAKVEGGASKGILGAVDPSFWETVKVEKTGHKMLFARGISRL